MKPIAAIRSTATTIVTLTLVLGAATATAGTPSDLDGLVGARGSSGEQELGSRGYSYVTMTHGTQYWWNAERKACVGIKVSQGRYKTVSSAPASQCGQKAASSGGGGHYPTTNPSNNAESNCMVRVNSNYGGKVKEILITGSKATGSDTVVMLKADGQGFKCVATKSGNVKDLRAVE
ncbi:MAG: hypothetical protein WBJ41_10665 [Chromatiaceae bacterium]